MEELKKKSSAFGQFDENLFSNLSIKGGDNDNNTDFK